jgi:hypothetical protein
MWEFLRRNESYRCDYENFMKEHGKWFSANGYWYDLEKRPNWNAAQEKYFYRRIAPEIVRLCVKWDICDLQPPTRRFAKEPQWGFKPDRPSSPPTGIAPELNWDYRLMDDLMKMGFTGTGGNARRYGHLLLLEFDLKWPMKDLVDFTRRVLVRAQENYKSGLQERGERYPKGRRRFEDYDLHLKIWDLKEGGKSISQIAAKVFPTDTKETSLQRVQDHLRSAQKLIRGHYKEIR